MKRVNNKLAARLKIDPEDEHLLEKYSWYIASNYASTMVTVGYKKRKTIRLHNLIMNPPPGLVVDHINGDTFDNKRANLRICSTKENSRNAKQKTYPGNKSKYKGVVALPSGRWGAHCSASHPRWIGTYDTQEEAARAYDEVAYRAYGSFARLNFPCG